MKPVRILLADDHPLIREAIGTLLSGAPEFELIGAVADGVECLTSVQEQRPDILLLDIAMPGINGEQVTRELRRLCPEVKIVALSGYADEPLVRALLKAGARAYVLKTASGRELIQALRAVLIGKRYISPEISGAAGILRGDKVRSAGLRLVEALGKREKEVLKLIAEGHRSAAIALRLKIAVATVDAHRRNILRKLRLHNAADLTRYALREGITSL